MIKIVFYGNESGARYWRFVDQAKYLEKSGKFQILIPSDNKVGDLMWADIIITQGLINKEMISWIYAAQQELGKKWVVEFDDWLVSNKDSPHKLEHDYNDAVNVITTQMRVCDMITTTTTYIADKFKKFNKNVRVLPNLLDPERWTVPIVKNREETVRIGWAGSMTHLKDFQECTWALKKVLKEYPNTELWLSGDPRIKDLFKGYDRVFTTIWPSMNHGINAYTSKLGSSRWDIGLAPIRDNIFNRCKSNIKPLEYGAFEIPCIASDVEPYKHFDNHVLLASTKEDWYHKLKTLIEDKPYRVSLGKEMKKYVWDNFDLSSKIGIFIEAYESLV